MDLVEIAIQRLFIYFAFYRIHSNLQCFMHYCQLTYKLNINYFQLLCAQLLNCLGRFPFTLNSNVYYHYRKFYRHFLIYLFLITKVNILFTKKKKIKLYTVCTFNFIIFYKKYVFSPEFLFASYEKQKYSLCVFWTCIKVAFLLHI